MLSAIRKRFTYANVAMTLALVFAMTGDAYADNKYLITSTKQISTKVINALKGANGKNGANGANGANGTNGAAGAKGENGAAGAAGAAGNNGSNGTSVTGAAIPTSEKNKCTGQGGVEYTSASGASDVCNGTTGFTSTLPEGKTEKGDWSLIGGSAGGFIGTAVSFNIPLAVVPAVHVIRANGNEIIVIGAGTPGEAPPGPGCEGSAANPTAAPGNLCIYDSEEIGIEKVSGGNAFPKACALGAEGAQCLASGLATVPSKADPSGFGISARVEGSTSFTEGTWAVTAE
jgi:hypothetical protein